MNSYFKSPKERPTLKSPVADKVYIDDNHPLTAELEKFYLEAKRAKEESNCDVIIMEGLFVLWDEKISNLADLKLFVECRSDERTVRLLKRNMGYGLSFDDISDVYLNLVRFRHDEYVEETKWKADFILNGSIPSEKTTAMLSDYIKKNLK